MIDCKNINSEDMIKELEARGYKITKKKEKKTISEMVEKETSKPISKRQYKTGKYLYVYTDNREPTENGDIKKTNRECVKNHDKMNPNGYEYVHIYDDQTGEFIRTEIANHYINTVRLWQKIANRSNNSFKENFNL